MNPITLFREVPELQPPEVYTLILDSLSLQDFRCWNINALNDETLPEEVLLACEDAEKLFRYFETRFHPPHQNNPVHSLYARVQWMNRMLEEPDPESLSEAALFMTRTERALSPVFTPTQAASSGEWVHPQDERPLRTFCHRRRKELVHLNETLHEDRQPLRSKLLTALWGKLEGILLEAFSDRHPPLIMGEDEFIEMRSEAGRYLRSFTNLSSSLVHATPLFSMKERRYEALLISLDVPRNYAPGALSWRETKLAHHRNAFARYAFLRQPSPSADEATVATGAPFFIFGFQFCDQQRKVEHLGDVIVARFQADQALCVIISQLLSPQIGSLWPPFLIRFFLEIFYHETWASSLRIYLNKHRAFARLHARIRTAGFSCHSALGAPFYEMDRATFGEPVLYRHKKHHTKGMRRLPLPGVSWQQYLEKSPTFPANFSLPWDLHDDLMDLSRSFPVIRDLFLWSGRLRVIHAFKEALQAVEIIEVVLMYWEYREPPATPPAYVIERFTNEQYIAKQKLLNDIDLRLKLRNNSDT